MGRSVSEQDRIRWNQRFAEGAYRQRNHPSALLAEQAGLLGNSGQALDIACGAGRNSLYLARLGFAVTAIDISDTALAQLNACKPASAAIRSICHDLDDGLPTLDRCYDLIIKMRFLKLDLLDQLLQLLSPGGVLVCEVLLQTDAAQSGVGPRESRFRAAPGALLGHARGLEILYSYEGLVTDPDGRDAAVAQLVARRDGFG